jgi:hypothetical protein
MNPSLVYSSMQRDNPFGHLLDRCTGPIHYDMSVQQTCRYMFILVYIGVCSGCSDVS